MAGQKISFLNRIRSSFNIFSSYEKGYMGNAQNDIEVHKVLLQCLSEHAKVDVAEARILDIGCGQLGTQVALFNADGADVWGVDLEVPTFTMTPAIFLWVCKSNGLERAIKSLIRHILFDKAYIKNLKRLYNKTVAFNSLYLRIQSATSLSFPDAMFDFIYSSYVFEHIDDVPKAVNEVNRVLKNNGIARVLIHLFPSLSGGHNLEWQFPDISKARKAMPWDHLLENKFPANAFLNKLRLHDYREIFNEYMKIKEEIIITKGTSHLTLELEAKLKKKGFSREDMISEQAIFICGKKK